MSRAQHRRQFLKAIGQAACLAGVAGAFGVRDAHGQSVLHPVRDGLWRVETSSAGVVVLETDDGLVMVDSGTAERAPELAALLDERFARPVRFLFNTRWHPDHTGGNDVFGDRGAQIIAHENTRLWMSQGVYVDWQQKTYASRPSHALPTATFYAHEPQPIALDAGGRRIAYAHLKQARSDGDIYVHFRDLDVIAAGAVVTGYEYPALDYVTGGWIGGLVEATTTLEALAGDDTLIVPARGAPLRREDLAAQRVMLETVRQRIEMLALEGRGASEIAAAGITAEFDTRWHGDAAQFIKTAYEGLWWGDRLRGRVA